MTHINKEQANMLTAIAMDIGSAKFNGARAVKNAFEYRTGSGDFKPGILDEGIVEALQGAGYTVSMGLAAQAEVGYGDQCIHTMRDLLMEIM